MVYKDSAWARAFAGAHASGRAGHGAHASGREGQYFAKLSCSCLI